MIDKPDPLIAAFSIRMAAGMGLPRFLAPLLLSMLACPSSVVRPSSALANPSICRLSCLGGEVTFSGTARRTGCKHLLLATVGTSGSRDGQGDRQNDAVCRSTGPMAGGGMGYARNHAMCGGSATCKQWEGLSCGEVDNIIHSVERYERVYSDTNLKGHLHGDFAPGPQPLRPSRGLFEHHRPNAGPPISSKARQPDADSGTVSSYVNAPPPIPGSSQGGSAWTPLQHSSKSTASSSADKPASFPGVDEDGHISYKLGDGLEPGITQPRGRYKILRSLGSGTYGKVVECWDRQAGAFCAVKVVRAVPKYRHAAKTEVCVLQDLQGDHRCVKMLRSFDYRGHICLVFELLGPNLYEIMRANNYKPFTISEIRSLAGQVLEALCHSHGKGVIHTDVKPENVLFQEQLHKRRSPNQQTQGRPFPVDSQVKLVDFGSAVYQHSCHATVVSTRHYRAPEIILKLGWSFPCDIWSIGCILYEMYTGEVLFGMLDELDHLAMIERVLQRIPQKLIRTALANGVEHSLFRSTPDSVYSLQWPGLETSESALQAVEKALPLQAVVREASLLDLMQSMLRLDPAERITAGDALRHPFFTGQPRPR